MNYCKQLMLDYLAMVYEDSDSTIVIAVMCQPKRVIFVLKLTLVLELWVTPHGYSLDLTG